MKRWMRKGIGVILLVGIVATVGVGTAFAAQEGPAAQPKKGPAILNRMAEATGLSKEAILEELQAGSTPAEILTANGVDPDAFVADLLAELQTRLDEVVAEGKISQEKADELMARAAERLPELMNKTFDFEGQGPGKGQGQGQGQAPQGTRLVGRNILIRLSDEAGLTVKELVEELQAGKTPAEVATEHGVDPDAFVAELLAELQTRLDEAVAEGKISQEKADDLMAQAAERLPELMNKTFEFEGPGPGNGQGPGGPGNGQGQGHGQGPMGGSSV